MKVTIREQAEEKFKAKQSKIQALKTPEETQLLLHELQVHQIELEIQNDELLRSHKELDSSRACYFDRFDLAPVGYLTLNEEGLILEANLAVLTMLGENGKNLIKNPFPQFVIPEDQDIYFLARKKMKETGDTHSCELRLKHNIGNPLWTQLQITCVSNGEYWMTLINISDRKQAEEKLRLTNSQLKEANDDLESFAAAVSHDLRAPLNIIGSFTNIILEDHVQELQSEVKDALQHVVGTTQRMSLVIEGLLQVSRLPHNEILHEQLNLSDIALSIATDLQNLKPAREIQFNIHKEIMATGDPTLLRIILTNLMTNAY